MPPRTRSVTAGLGGALLPVLSSSPFAFVVRPRTRAGCPEAALNACLPGAGGFDGTVTFACGGAATITVTSTKNISADTTIDGGRVITISGGNSVVLFAVTSGAAFTVDNLTLANGLSTSGSASAIAGSGGGLGLGGGRALTVINSTLHNNTGNDAVGFGTGTLTLANSTFSDNSGVAGVSFGTGGVTATVTNCTFVGNGTGLLNQGSNTITVTNSTFSHNSAVAVENAGGTLTVTNSILASSGSNCSGTITDRGHNIEYVTTCGFKATGCSNTTGLSFCNTNPLLDPAGLVSNGGPTQTIALCAGSGTPASCTGTSPAINAGDETVCMMSPVNNLDQRGFVRPGAGATKCSIGAYEANASPPSCTPPPSGLVSWWPGDGNANDIVGTNNGTLQGGATFAAGEVGQAFSLNGVNNFVSVPNSDTLNPTGPFGVDLW